MLTVIAEAYSHTFEPDWSEMRKHSEARNLLAYQYGKLYSVYIQGIHVYLIPYSIQCTLDGVERENNMGQIISFSSYGPNMCKCECVCLKFAPGMGYTLFVKDTPYVENYFFTTFSSKFEHVYIEGYTDKTSDYEQSVRFAEAVKLLLKE